jgi:transposase
MAHLQAGRDYHEIAAALRVPKITVQGWVQRFKADGLDGLRESRRSGAKRKLATAQEAGFKAAAMRLQGQRPGGRVTGHDIRVLLARLGLVWITVRSKHPKQSQAGQDTFKKTSVRR